MKNVLQKSYVLCATMLRCVTLLLVLAKSSSGQDLVTSEDAGKSMAAQELLNRVSTDIEFVENKGQWPDSVILKADMPYGQALVTAHGMIAGIFDPESLKAISEQQERREAVQKEGNLFQEKTIGLKGHGWQVKFLNSSANAFVEKQKRNNDHYNYFLGDDPKKFATDVNSYGEVWYRNVYHQTDVRYYTSKEGTLEYDVICNPGSNPDSVLLEIKGIDKIYLSDNGNLVITTSIGNLEFPSPYAYQLDNGKEKKVDVSYQVLAQNQLSFNIGNYDPSLPLIIDPIALRWATWITNNSSNGAHGHGIWVDNVTSNIYVTGYHNSTGLITVGAFQNTNGGGQDIFIGKYTEPAAIGGSGIRVWQTYLGGTSTDNSYAIEQGPDGNIYMVGVTASTNWPLLGGSGFTGTSIDNRTQTTDNIFITKINTAGNSIKSAVVGGNTSENVFDLRIAANGDVIVIGSTSSTNMATLFPSSGASNTNVGSTDVLMFKINQNLSTMVWMKNYGGTGADVGNIIVTNTVTGDIYVAGQTASSNFPTTLARQTGLGGTQSGFLQKYKSDGTQQWSSYFKSASGASSAILCMEFTTAKNKLVFGGITTGLDATNISSSGVYKSTYSGSTDFFVCRMDTNQTFNYATYFGGSSTETNLMGLNTDANDDIYLFGYSSSTNYPVTANALQSTNLGNGEKVFSKISALGSSLLYGTYYGGASAETDPRGERGIKFANCRIYTIVTAQSNDIPLTVGALTTTKSSSTSLPEPGIVVWANPPDLAGNTLAGNQVICPGTVPATLTGSTPSYVLPTITRNSVTSAHPSLGSAATYQWQISTDSLNWTDVAGGTTQNLAGTLIGPLYQKTYFRRVIGGDACTLPGAAGQVVIVNVFSVFATINNVSCNGLSNGSLTTSIVGGTAPYTYLWNNGATTPNRTNLPAGTYTVTVTDATSCTATNSFTVTQPDVLTVSSTTTAATCGSSNGSISLTVSNGTAPYTFMWSNGATTQNISSVAAGSYTVTVTDAHACVKTLTSVVSNNSTTITSTVTNVTCNGGNNGAITLTSVTGNAPFSYQWSDGPTTQNRTGLTAGNYTVVVTDNLGCVTSKNFTVTEPAFSISVAVTQNITCFGLSNGAVGVTTSGGVSPFTYLWSNGMTTSTITGLAAGNYSVTVTAANGCTKNGSITLSQPPQLSASCTIVNSINCNGAANGQVTVNATGGTGAYTYLWNTGSTLVAINNLGPGTYTVTVKDNAGCTAVCSSILTQPNALAISGTITNPACHGNSNGSIALNVTGGTTPYSYLWNDGNTNASRSGLPGGNYSVQVADANGCLAIQSFSLTDPSAVTASVSSQINVLCFGNSTGSVTVAGSGGTPSYQYGLNGGTFQSSGSFSNLAAGSYTVTVKDANGCTVNQVVNITQPASALGSSVSSQTGVLCFGNSTGSVTVVGSGGTPSYQYSLNGGTFQSSGTFSNLAAGSYTVTVKDANGCTVNQAVSITQPASALSSSSTQTNVLCFGNTTGSATVTGSGGTSPYQYSLNGGTYQSSGTFSGLAAGAYTVTVKDANGCQLNKNVTITQPASALASSIISQTNVLCFENSSGSVTVLGSGGTSPYQYSLNGGTYQSSGTFTNLTAGSYSITVKDANGCTLNQGVNITQPASALSASISTQTDVLCFGNATGSVTVGGAGGTSPYQYSLNGGAYQASGTFANLTAGSYNVIVKDANGCTVNKAVVITQPSSPLSASVTQVNVLCSGNTTGSVTVAGSGGTSPYQYNLNGGIFQSSGTFGSLAAGSYTVTVKDANGCTLNQQVNITQPASAVGSSVSSQINVLCFGNTTGSVTVAGSGGTPSYQYSLNGGIFQSSGSFSNLAAGSYTVTVKDANGCTVNQAVNITQPASALGSSISSQTGVLCFGNSTGSVTVAGSGGTPSYQYSLNGGTFQTSGTFSNLASGSYTVTVKDANGCTVNQAVSITQPASALSSSSTQTNVLCFGNTTGSATVTGSGGTSPYQYSLNGGTYQSSGTFSGLAAGAYTVTVKDANGCTINANVAILQPLAPLSASGILTNASCGLTSDGAVNLTVNGGTTPYSYLWSNSFTTEDISSLAQGTYTVTITDANQCSLSKSFTLTAGDCQPFAVNDAITTNEDTPVSGSVATNDAASGDGGNIWSLVSGASNGSVIVNSNGSYTYSPDANYNGTDQFSYQVCDVDGDCSTATVTITISPVDDQPLAVNDVATTNEDTPVSGTVSGNDTPSGDGGNTWSLVTNGSNGTAVVNNDGSYTYTPNANYNGTDQFSYEVCDVDGDCSTATVTITISPADDQPLAVNDAATTNEDTPVSGTVSTNDTPSGDGGNTWSLVTNGSNGTAVVNSDGSYTYTPNANYNGTDQFSYQVCDVDGDCSTATVTITITPVDDQPLAGNDAATTNEDTPISGSVATNDTPSGDGGNTWSLVTNGNNGTAVVNSDGSYTYTPNANYNGTDQFSYQVCDVDGDCSTATVTVTINPVDDQPFAVNDAATTSEDTPVSGTVATNDAASGDGGNTWSLVTNGSNGTAVVNSDGSYTYTPDANYNGTDQFSYQVCDVDGDCSTATVTVTITPVDDQPFAVNDAATTNEDMPVSGSVAGNDTPSGDGGNIWSLVSGASNGSVIVNSNGSYTYTPDANYNGTDQFSYQVCDVDGDCSTATVTITINPVDDEPLAVNDAATTNEDTPVSGTVATNDAPSGDGGNTWSLVTNGSNGTAVVNSDGSYTYTPNANYNGTDQFSYQVCDVDGDCSAATVTITISPVDDQPLTVNDANTTNEDTPVSGTVATNDTPSGDGGNTWSLVTNGSNGTAVVNSDGSYTYTPNANYNGTDQFTYQVCDVDGDCSTATVTVTINAVDDQPFAVNDAATTNEDTPVSGTVATNDAPSGDGGNIWSLVSGASNGSVVLNPDGSYTYTPNANYNGTDQFTYQVCDVDGDCSTATVTITINPVDDQPVAVDDATTTNEDTPISGSAADNDAPSGDGGNMWSLVTNGTNGTAVVNTDGSYTYTPNANYNGTDEFTYQVCDVDGDCSTATVTVTVNADNDHPVANNDIVITSEDTPVSGIVATNDAPSGDGGNTWSLATNGSNGTVVVNTDGSYTYTPNANYNGTDQFSYQVCDVDGDCSTATVTVTITSVDDQPVAVNDAATINEDTPVSGTVETNDTPSGDGGNTWNLVTNGSNGTAVVNSDGSYNYTPNANYNGTDQFSYQVCDVDGDCSTATVTITINPVDDQPLAVNDAATTNEDIPVSGTVATNDAPSGDGGNTWSLVTNGSNGTAVVNTDGSYTYTPNANYNGTDQFSYQVCDVDGDCSAATVTVTISPVDDQPLAVNDAATTNEDTPVSGTVSTNDTPSGDGGNIWSLVSGASNGSVIVNSNGSYTYTPDANYNGTDQFSYQVCDVDGDCSTATVTVTISPVDDQPLAADDATTTNEDTPMSGSVAGNDTPSGDGGNTWSLVTNGSNGTAVVNSDGSYTYTPNANYNGTDQFSYEVCDVDGDCSVATVTITISPVDDQPLAVNDAATTNEDTPVSGTVATNDTPSGDGGNTWSLVTNGSNGTAVVNSDGSYTYTPNANYNGTDQFSYQVCDVDGDCSTATVTVTITPVDDQPLAVNDAATTNEDTPVSGTVATNDAASGDGGNIWSLVTNGSNGTAVVNSDGSYTYTPNANYNGIDQFSYQVCDADGDCATATVTVTISPVDDQPLAVNDAATTNEDMPVSGSVTGNDTPSGDGGNIWSLVSGASNGSVIVNSNGSYTYTPDANYNGTDQFSYQVCDVDGDCSTATVTITINPVDDQPLAVNDAATTNEDTPVSGSVAGNDTPSGDGGNTWSLVTNGSNGTAVVNNDGSYTYTPNANYNGTDQFSYQVCDVDGDCSAATVTITINPVDDQPLAVNDAVTTNEDTPVSGTVATNDAPSGDGGNTWSLVTNGSNGTAVVNSDGSYTYTPNANYNGTDQFSYQVCDVDGDCSTATVTITINPVDDQPLAVNDAATTNEDTPVSGTVSTNDTPSGDGGNTWSLVTNGSNGTAVVNSDGSYTYTPNANYNGTDQFSYQVCDVDGDCSAATVTITITSVDDQPFAVNDAATTNEDTPVSGTVATNDAASGDGGNIWSLVSGASNGSVIVNSNGSYTYTPDANYNGTDQFSYQVCDVDGDCATATVTITINPVDDQPLAVNDAVTTNEDIPVSGTVATNDTPSGDGGNTWSLVTNGSNGMAVVNSDGSYTYTPNANYNGTDQFSYQVCDVDGDCSAATVTVTINADNDHPVVNNDIIITSEDTPVSGTVATNDAASGDGGNIWSLVTNGSNGTAVVNSDGSYTYTPNANYNGTDQFSYQVCDVDGDCSTATVTVTISPVDDQPFAVNDAATTNEDTPISGSVAGNDTPSGDGGNTWSLVTNGSNGTAVVNSDGSYTYTPNANYNGTDQFSYQVCDVDGDCSAATVTVTISPVDDQPLAVNDAATTSEDTPVSGSVAGNDTPSGDGGNIWSLVTNGSNGTAVVNSDGSYTYTPDANYNGTDQFSYQVCDADGDCSTATVTITINPVDDQPLAVDDATTTNEDTPVSGSVSASNDVPSGDGGNTWSLVTNGSNGTAVVNSDGSYTYTPNANYNGTDQFTYQVCDMDGDCSTATVTITISPVDDQPLAVNDAATTNEDTPVSGTVAANDAASGDGGNIWSLVSGALNGSVIVNSNGSYTYTPDANYNGTDQFTYQVCDVDGDCSAATVTVTISPVDDQPLAVNDAATTNEDTPVSGMVSTNDTPSGDGGNIWTLLTNGANGNVVFNSDGSYTYTPGTDYNGTDQFSYQVCDVDGDCSTGFVNITINAGNDNPIANNDNFITNEDVPLNGSVAGNDVSSGDGDNMWSLVSDASHGGVVMNADGTFLYTPDLDYNGADQFSYQVCDADGDCSTGNVNIVINAVDDQPVAVTDSISTNEDTPISGTLASNDILSGDGGNSWSLVSGAANGSVNVNADGSYTYQPNADFNGTDQFIYQLCDNDGDCVSAIVNVTVVSIDDQPLAVNDAASTNEDVPLSASVAPNDHLSGDGGNIWSLVSGAANGLVILNSDGTYLYTPDANYNGPDQFTYRICDGDGDCSIATVSITINPVNDYPAAGDDAVSTSEDTPVSGTLTTNDTPSGDGGNLWTLLTNGNNGVAIVNSDGTYTYTPNANYHGTDQFTYQLCDGNGDCAAATVMITIISVNDMPLAVNDAITTNEDTPVSGTVAGNDTPSGDGGNVWSLVAGGAHGVASVNTDGSYTYIPDADFFGTDQFTYQVCDIDGECSTAIVSITIISVDDQPYANDDAFTTNEDQPISGTLADNDFPSGDGGNIWSLVSGASNGSVIINPDGTYTYTPNANYYGTDQFTYKICDVDGDCVTSVAMVNISVVAVDDAPTAVDDNVTTNEDNLVNGSVAGNDTGSGDGGNTWSLVSGAAHGSVTVNADGSFTYTPDLDFSGTDHFSYQVCDIDGDCSTALVTITVNEGDDLPVVNNDNVSTNEDAQLSGTVANNDLPSGDGTNNWSLVSGTSHGTVVVNPDGTFSYIPDPDYNGPDQFTYQLCDSDGDCIEGIVNISVIPVDDVPFAMDDSNTTSEDVPVSGSVIANDVLSGDGGNSWSLVSGASNGSVIMNPDGTYTYSPNANYNGSDQFTYQLCDADGDCAPANVVITIVPVDNQPLAVDDAATTSEDTPLSGSVINNDVPSGDGGNTWSLVIQALHGTVVVNSDGSYTYTPDANYNGTDEFTYQVCDADGDCSVATATVIITVSSVNDLPFAVNDATTTYEDTPVSGDASVNDTPSGDGGNTWSLVSNPSNGTAVVNTDGTYTYTPDLNFHGTDQFIYQLCDVDGDCSSATVKITIIQVDDQPLAVDDALSTNEDTPVNGTLASNDMESGDGGNTWSLVIGASHGTVVVNSDGTYSYIPDANYNGTDQFTYQLCDLDGDCSSAAVSININSVDDLPAAVNDAFATNEDTPFSGSVAGNDVISLDGGNTWSLLSNVIHGTLVLNSNGTFNYTPAANYNGIDSFTYQLCDADGDCSIAAVIITINGSDDVPAAFNDVFVTNEDVVLTGTVAGNDAASGDGGNTWSLTGAASNGTVILNPDGSFTYTPGSNYNGMDQFTYQLCDADGDCSSATVTINIQPVNDPPVAVGDVNTTDQNVPVSGSVAGNDSDVDGNLNSNSFTVIANPLHGLVTLSSNGTYTYTPNTNYTGQDVFEYQVCDLGMPIYCDTALVNITINPAGCVCTAPVTFTVDSVSPVAASLCWNSVPCATAYLVAWKMQGAQMWIYRKVPAPQHCSTFTNNYPAIYEIMVASICSNGDTSAYSDLFIFHTYPSCLPPVNLYTDNITSSKATAHWTHGTDMASQNIWYRQAGNAAWIQKNLTATASSYQMKNLSASTFYQWKVRSVCKDGSRVVKGQFSQVKGFKTLGMTMLKLQQPAPPMLIYPNPTISGKFEMSINLQDDAITEATVVIVNIMGASVYTHNIPVIDGLFSCEINLQGLAPAGIYYIHVMAGDKIYKEQVVYQP